MNPQHFWSDPADIRIRIGINRRNWHVDVRGDVWSVRTAPFWRRGVRLLSAKNVQSLYYNAASEWTMKQWRRIIVLECTQPHPHCLSPSPNSPVPAWIVVLLHLLSLFPSLSIPLLPFHLFLSVLCTMPFPPCHETALLNPANGSGGALLAPQSGPGLFWARETCHVMWQRFWFFLL